MRITPQRATLWADAYASVLRGLVEKDLGGDPTLILRHARTSAEQWLALREGGYPITRSIITDAAAAALGLPDGKPQTIRNFLRGL